MNDRINVTVNKERTQATFRVGRLGLWREIVVDLTDANKLANGLVEIANLGDQLVQTQMAELAKRVEKLETLSKDDLQYLGRLVRLHPREFRSDGRPTSDDKLANKLEGLAKS